MPWRRSPSGSWAPSTLMGEIRSLDPPAGDWAFEQAGNGKHAGLNRSLRHRVVLGGKLASQHTSGSCSYRPALPQHQASRKAMLQNNGGKSRTHIFLEQKLRAHPSLSRVVRNERGAAHGTMQRKSRASGANHVARHLDSPESRWRRSMGDLPAGTMNNQDDQPSHCEQVRARHRPPRGDRARAHPRIVREHSARAHGVRGVIRLIGRRRIRRIDRCA